MRRDRVVNLRPEKARPVGLLNGFKSTPQKVCRNKGSNLNGVWRTVAFQKKKLSFIIMLYIKTSNEECFISSLTLRRVPHFFGGLVGCFDQ